MKSSVLLIALTGLTATALAQTAPKPAPGVRMIEPGKEPGKPGAAGSDAPAKPEPIKPASVAPPAAKPEDHTTIDSEASAMDTKNSIAIFSGSVIVKGPQFKLTTDGDFEVHMKKQPKEDKADPAKGDGKGDAKSDGKGKAPDAKGTPKGTPPPAVTPATAAQGLDKKTAPDDNGVEKAIATGKVVTIEKKDAEGNVKIGKSRNALYDGKSGDITLRDWPQVQDGKNVIIATEASTYMVLTQDGHLKVFGRARTDIVGNQGAPGKPPGPGQ